MKRLSGRFVLTCAVLTLAAADGLHTPVLELQGNVAFVKASTGNSAPLDMVPDSGTIRTTLDEAVATTLGLGLKHESPKFWRYLTDSRLIGHRELQESCELQGRTSSNLAA